MCGIWALFGSDVRASTNLQSFFRISHRGSNSWKIQNVTSEEHVLGFHEITRADAITKSVQPFNLTGDLDHLWLLFDGEIYNRQQIKEEFNFTYETEMGGECILHLYHKLGVMQTLQCLDGVFALCLVDTAKEEIIVARDVMGVRSLYKLTTESHLGICSEAKGLVKVEFDESTDMELEQFTPGHVEIYSMEESGSVTLEESTAFMGIGDAPEYAPELEHIISEVQQYEHDEIYANLREKLTCSVRRKMRSTRKMGCLLSGGIGSSLVAALLVQEAQGQGISEPIQTFTFGFEGSVDMMHARKVAEYIGSDHTEVMVTTEDLLSVVSKVVYHMEDADVDSIRDATVMYTAMQYIRENTEDLVIFAGDGLSQLRPSYTKATTHVEAEESCRLVLASIHETTLQRTDRMSTAHGIEVSLPCVDVVVIAFYLSIKSEIRFSEKVIDKKSRKLNRKKQTEVKSGKTTTHKLKSNQELATERNTTTKKANKSKSPPSTDSQSSVDDDEKPKAKPKQVRQAHIKRTTSNKAESNPKPKKPLEKPKKKSSASIRKVGLASENYAMDCVQGAFYGCGLVPDEILMRDRMTLSEGILPEDQTWEETFQAHFDKKVSFFEYRRAYRKYPKLSPITKEAVFYRMSFDAFFHGYEELITTSEE